MNSAEKVAHWLRCSSHHPTQVVAALEALLAERLKVVTALEQTASDICGSSETNSVGIAHTVFHEDAALTTGLRDHLRLLDQAHAALLVRLETLMPPEKRSFHRRASTA